MLTIIEYNALKSTRGFLILIVAFQSSKSLVAPIEGLAVRLVNPEFHVMKLRQPTYSCLKFLMCHACFVIWLSLQQHIPTFNCHERVCYCSPYPRQYYSVHAREYDFLQIFKIMFFCFSSWHFIFYRYLTDFNFMAVLRIVNDGEIALESSFNIIEIWFQLFSIFLRCFSGV